MQIAIVTGGSSGIGEVFSRSLATLTSDLDEVWCLSRCGISDSAYAQTPTGAAVSSHSGIPVRSFQFDQACRTFPEKLQKLIEAEGAEVQYLVANAAQVDPGTVLTQSYAVASSMVATNVIGTMGTVYAALPAMSTGSHIILVSSISAYAPTPGLGVYSATKAFITHWGTSLREELRLRGISVTVVNPGKVETRSLHLVAKQVRRRKLALMPTQNVGRFVDISLAAARRGRAEVTPGRYGLVVAAFRLIPKQLLARLTKLQG